MFYLKLIKYLNNKSKTNSVFVKLLDGIGDKSKYKFSSAVDINDVENLFEVFNFVSFIIYLRNDKSTRRFSRIYPYSINTLRIYSFKDKYNNVDIISSLMRFGGNKGLMYNNIAGCYFVPGGISD